MLAKIGLYATFLVIYFAYFAVMTWYAQRLQKYNDDGSWQPPKRLSRIAEAQASILSAPTYLLYLYVLTGFFSLPLFVVWTASLELGALVGELLIPGDPKRMVEWRARLDWTSGMLARRASILFFVGFLLAFLVAIALPIGVAFAFFAHHRPSPDLTEATLKVTLVLTALPAYLISSPLSIAQLVSVTSDAAARNRILANSVVSLLPTAIGIGLLFWVFNIGGSGQAISLGGVPIAFSSPFVTVLFGIFAIRSLGPFFTGAYRTKNYRIRLHNEEKRLLTRVLDKFDLPLPGSIDAEIEQLACEIDAESDEIGEAGLLKPDADAPIYLKHLAWAGSVIRSSDPLLTHHDWLLGLSRTLREVGSVMKASTTIVARDRIRESGAAGFRRRRDDLTEDIEAIRLLPAPHVVVWTLVGVPAISLVVSELARFMAANYLHAAVK